MKPATTAEIVSRLGQHLPRLGRALGQEGNAPSAYSTVTARLDRAAQYSVSSQWRGAADAVPFTIVTAYWFARLKRAMTAEIVAAPRSTLASAIGTFRRHRPT
ncbi:hypothetical protein DB459_15270 [Bradyrhizobium sp. WD16]|nr:hypothetical protein DB459_15270 [Bradyrhizobium sp. WD16]